jgi:hypothetical protein
MAQGQTSRPAKRSSARSTESDEEIASALCNHDVVACALAATAIRWVRQGRRTPEEAVARLIEICPCGEVDVRRAVRVLERVRRAALAGAGRH